MGGFGHLVKGFIKAGASARAGYGAGKIEGEAESYKRKKVRDEHLRDLEEIQMRRDLDVVRRSVERERLTETTRHNREMEKSAAIRAAKTGAGGTGGDQPQWRAVAEKAAQYRREGLPANIANIRARQEMGASVDAAEESALKRYQKNPANRGAAFKGITGGSSTSAPRGTPAPKKKPEITPAPRRR
jgi:uncharacterized protein YbcC (UPF0753/DUF2309 family)